MSFESPNSGPTQKEIESEKDKVDLRPAIDFIEKNQGIYHTLERSITEHQSSTFVFTWARHIRFEQERNIRGPQISPTEAAIILSSVPEVLAGLSKLRFISYEYGDKVIEPIYKPDGTLETGNTVPFDEFGTRGEHPTRLLVGLTPFSGDGIYMSALPSTVYRNGEAARMYQMHVLFHEFFHTVEIAIRDPQKRQAILLEADGRPFTFQDWWAEFEQFVLARAEKPVSRYAAGYEHDLTENAKESRNDEFTHALAEQICESFVAYQQNIIPNDDGETDFKTAWPTTWSLMDRLCRAKIIKTDDKLTI